MEESFQRISASEAEKLLKNEPALRLIDVREEAEYEFCRIEGATNCPLSSFAEAIQKANLQPNDKLLLYCHHGVRSAKAAQLLWVEGYSNLYNLEGGIDAWSQEVDPSVPQY